MRAGRVQCAEMSKKSRWGRLFFLYIFIYISLEEKTTLYLVSIDAAREFTTTMSASRVKNRSQLRYVRFTYEFLL